MKKLKAPTKSYLAFYLLGNREEYTLLFLAVFSAILFGFIVVFPGLLGSLRFINNIQKEKEVLQTLNQKIENLEEAEASYSKIKHDINLLDEALPNSYHSPSLLREISLTLGRHHLDLKTIRFEKTRTNGQSRVTLLPFTIEFTGNYSDFLKALQEFEHGARGISMRNLRISRLANRPGVEVNLGLIIYFYNCQDPCPNVVGRSLED